MRQFLALASILLVAVGRPAAGQDNVPAKGFAVWLRVPNGTLADWGSNLISTPPFAVGHRGERVAFGVGFGVTAYRSADQSTFGIQSSKDEVKATAYQIGPSLLVDVWHSGDRRTRGNIAAGITVGRVSFIDKSTFTGVGPPQVTETKSAGTLLGLHAALGGQHFLHQHFALGVEAGLRGAFALGVKEEGNPNDRLSVGANGTYAGLTATIVF